MGHSEFELKFDCTCKLKRSKSMPCMSLLKLYLVALDVFDDGTAPVVGPEDRLSLGIDSQFSNWHCRA
jgi:hypothetical protein